MVGDWHLRCFQKAINQQVCRWKMVGAFLWRIEIGSRCYALCALWNFCKRARWSMYSHKRLQKPLTEAWDPRPLEPNHFLGCLSAKKHFKTNFAALLCCNAWKDLPHIVHHQRVLVALNRNPILSIAILFSIYFCFTSNSVISKL